ncbi:hypothetical protein FGB62_81g014 [Gracilaria domingensis]|nr:hypothetical protein FGB62_81g014 [Gracilaria domingensis]
MIQTLSDINQSLKEAKSDTASQWRQFRIEMMQIKNEMKFVVEKGLAKIVPAFKQSSNAEIIPEVEKDDERTKYAEYIYVSNIVHDFLSQPPIKYSINNFVRMLCCDRLFGMAYDDECDDDMLYSSTILQAAVKPVETVMITVEAYAGRGQSRAHESIRKNMIPVAEVESNELLSMSLFSVSFVSLKIFSSVQRTKSVRNITKLPSTGDMNKSHALKWAKEVLTFGHDSERLQDQADTEEYEDLSEEEFYVSCAINAVSVYSGLSDGQKE